MHPFELEAVENVSKAKKMYYSKDNKAILHLLKSFNKEQLDWFFIKMISHNDQFYKVVWDIAFDACIVW